MKSALLGALEIYESVEQLAYVVAREIADACEGAVAARGTAALALAGGRTPRSIYESLASLPLRDRIDWPCVELFFGDERCVAPGADDSNYAMVAESLLSRVPVDMSRVHRIRCEARPRVAADEYERLLRERLGDSGCFDVTLLGMGADGHTASIFPSSVIEEGRWVQETRSDIPPHARVTLTPSVLVRSRLVLVIVTGAAKSERLRRVLREPPDPVAQPVQRIAAPDVRWRVDRSAASRLVES